MFRVMNNKLPVAMGYNLGQAAPAGHRLDSMQHSITGRPEFDLFNQIKKIDIFAIVSLFVFCCLAHSIQLLIK